MRLFSSSSFKLALVLVPFVLAAGCASKSVSSGSGARPEFRPKSDNLEAVKLTEPVLLRLKAQLGRTEKVAYAHRSISKSYEENQLRHEKEEKLNFVSQAETLRVDPPDARNVQRFSQVLSIVKKDGNADLHDFAMPDLGEKLEVTADSTGTIFKSGDYPANSVFFVAPMSLPEKPVSIGDTWTMQASWLSLEEMVPYQLDMVSILKGFWKCGSDTCAEIEISGDVGFQGPLSKTLQFKSSWHGRIYFAMTAGTVLWSRVDSDERLVADRIRRDVDSCLEATLIEPAEMRIAGLASASCEPVPRTDTQLAK